jgi:hypothetical protein
MDAYFKQNLTKLAQLQQITILIFQKDIFIFKKSYIRFPKNIASLFKTILNSKLFRIKINTTQILKEI